MIDIYRYTQQSIGWKWNQSEYGIRMNNQEYLSVCASKEQMSLKCCWLMSVCILREFEWMSSLENQCWSLMWLQWNYKSNIFKLRSSQYSDKRIRRSIFDVIDGLKCFSLNRMQSGIFEKYFTEKCKFNQTFQLLVTRIQFSGKHKSTSIESQIPYEFIEKCFFISIECIKVHSITNFNHESFQIQTKAIKTFFPSPHEI